MRVLVENYGDARIFYDRIFGYKRYHVEYKDGSVSTYSGLWYSEKDIKRMVLEKIENNQNLIQSLTKTRDTLLPKLMSGQVRVNNIKKTADA